MKDLDQEQRKSTNSQTYSSVTIILTETKKWRSWVKKLIQLVLD